MITILSVVVPAEFEQLTPKVVCVALTGPKTDEPPFTLAVPDHPPVFIQFSAPVMSQVTVVVLPRFSGFGVALSDTVGLAAAGGMVLGGVPPAAVMSASTVVRNDCTAGSS